MAAPARPASSASDSASTGSEGKRRRNVFTGRLRRAGVRVGMFEQAPGGKVAFGGVRFVVMVEGLHDTTVKTPSRSLKLMLQDADSIRERLQSMRSRICPPAVVAALALPCAGALLAPAARAAGPALSPSAYAVSRLCAQPSPGHAGCLGLKLVAKAPLSVPHARALGAPARGRGGSPATEFTQPIPAS